MMTYLTMLTHMQPEVKIKQTLTILNDSQPDRLKMIAKPIAMPKTFDFTPKYVADYKGASIPVVALPGDAALIDAGRSDRSEKQLAKLLTVNRLMQEHNFTAAEYFLGRKLTPDEIKNQFISDLLKPVVKKEDIASQILEALRQRKAEDEDEDDEDGDDDDDEDDEEEKDEFSLHGLFGELPDPSILTTENMTPTHEERARGYGKRAFPLDIPDLRSEHHTSKEMASIMARIVKAHPETKPAFVGFNPKAHRRKYIEAFEKAKKLFEKHDEDSDDEEMPELEPVPGPSLTDAAMRKAAIAILAAQNKSAKKPGKLQASAANLAAHRAAILARLAGKDDDPAAQTMSNEEYNQVISRLLSRTPMSPLPATPSAPSSPKAAAAAGRGVNQPSKRGRNQKDWVKFGPRFLINERKLKDNNELSVMYPNGQKPACIRNQQLSSALKTCVMDYMSGNLMSTMNLTQPENTYLQWLWGHCRMPKAAPEKVQEYKMPPPYRGNVEKMKTRLEVLIGECNAGNDSPRIIDEIIVLTHRLRDALTPAQLNKLKRFVA